MNEIQAIRERHSVRTYQPRQIEKEKVDQLNALIEECNREGGLHIQFLKDAGRTYDRFFNKAMGLGTAPSVIACVGKEAPDLEERIGYYGEKIVLYAQTLGLNTCWTGTYNAKGVPADIADGERLVIVIAIGYGNTPGKPHKSKKLEQVVSCKGERPYWFNFGVEMALLAPTAINQQKFEFRLEENGTVTAVDKGGILSKVDLGIVKYHFDAGVNYMKSQKKRER